ncbi:Murein L,D-transpeptidase YcbB/YkuD [Flavobacterium swingsii]|uniref:Murein L,D-transpeptidase YcbB/YkuD n=1 Tax=Flavobacterium swingsii TaxID=498292 RepID=A0A1I0VTF3_9FLAO|nr:L,D-transpeptidase family protein [Flavobacterium swingsii]SFA79307.1 Murein L,D-transpeptidase YcbB/YkuD [Flavobacterium swingsii]
MKPIYLLIPLIIFICCKKNTLEKNSDSTSFINFPFLNLSVKIDSTLISSFNNPNLTAFYKNYSNETVWTSQDNRDVVLNEFKNATNEGLLPNDYNYDKLNILSTNYNSLDDIKLVELDLLFTQSIQKYLSHIHKGKISPKVVEGDWDLTEKKIDVNALLFESIENNDFTSRFEDLKPKHPLYKNLKEALQLLNTFPKDSVPFIILKPKDKISFNKSNKVVKTIKQRLMYWHDMKQADTLTNIYDKETQDAVKLFQSRHGLYPDGVIGKGTLLALNFTKDQRIEQVIANLERWRWFANDFGKNYLLINIPDYSLVAIKDNDTMQKQRVVVGKEARQTPIIESKVSNINLNPNWTVPPTILKEDVYPDAIKDRGAFKKKGLIILNNKNKEVSPWDWKMEDAKKYKYVQNPGRNSALGLMKINFPNKYSVYLHDTNHRDYFSFTYRSLSSGCVRLEKPLEMAAYLINKPEKWDLKTIQDTTDINYYNKLHKEKLKKIAIKNAKLLAKNPLLVIPEKVYPKPELKTIVVKISDDIYIHQLYWTAWLQKGSLQFREDIYCLDYDLYSKLRN